MKKVSDPQVFPKVRLNQDGKVSKYTASHILTWNPKIVIGPMEPFNSYLDLKRELEESPNDLTYPMRTYHSFNTLVAPQIRVWLTNLGLAWVEDTDTVFEVKIWNQKEAQNYVLFATYLDELMEFLEASDLLEQINKTRKINHIRKLTLRHPLPLPLERFTYTQIMEELMSVSRELLLGKG